MITNFLYNDVVLYCKGWYKRKDLIDDLSYLFSQIYGWKATNESEVAGMMLRVIDKLYSLQGVKFLPCSQNYSFFGLYSKVKNYASLYEYSQDKATIHVCMNILAQLEMSEIKLNPPHFSKKERFRLGAIFGEYPISQTYAEMNRIARKTFSE